MNDTSQRAKDVSITPIAAAYVVCLIAGGLAILIGVQHAHSGATLAVCTLVVAAACAGAVFSTRGLLHALRS